MVHECDVYKSVMFHNITINTTLMSFMPILEMAVCARARVCVCERERGREREGRARTHDCVRLTVLRYGSTLY